MKKGASMIGQLVIDFDWNVEPMTLAAPLSAVDEADAIIEKYLRISATTCESYHEFCYGLKKTDNLWYKRCERKRELLKQAAKRMIMKTGLEVAYFFDTENRYYEEVAKCEDKKKSKEYRQEHENKKNAELRLLDGFGYIQQLFNRKYHIEERYVEDGEEFDPDNCENFENGKPIGYWYWLFEDAITQVPVPLKLIDRYVEKYA